MTKSSKVDTLFAMVAVLASTALGIITLYTSGIGLLDPKMHRAGGFALALIVGVAVSRNKQESSGIVQTTIDCGLILVGLWSIWAFYFVQTEMEVTLYDVTIKDAWPALTGLVVFLELTRRLWGWGLFSVSAMAVLYLLFGRDFPGILAHSGFSLQEVSEALWYNTNKGVFGSITSIVLNTVFIFIIFGALLEGTGAGQLCLSLRFL